MKLIVVRLLYILILLDSLKTKHRHHHLHHKHSFKEKVTVSKIQKPPQNSMENFFDLIDRMNKLDDQLLTKKQIEDKGLSKEDTKEQSKLYGLLFLRMEQNSNNLNIDNLDVLRKEIKTIKKNEKSIQILKIVYQFKDNRETRYYCVEFELNSERKQKINLLQSRKSKNLNHALKTCGFENFLGEDNYKKIKDKKSVKHHHTTKEINQSSRTKNASKKKKEKITDAYYKDKNNEEKLFSRSKQTESHHNGKNSTSSHYHTSKSTSKSYSHSTNTMGN